MAPSRKQELTAAAEALNAASGGSGRVDIEQLHKTVNVTESNGEISCSVEDTNKLRAALGLKPLRIKGEEDSSVATKSAEEIAVDNFAQKKAKEDKEKELAEIQVRLEKARKKRLLKEKLSGPTLGDADGDMDAAEWVKKSRENAKIREAKLMAEKQRRLLEEQEASYTSQDLKGIKIGHGMNEIMSNDFTEVDAEGGVVLTLKDSSILDQDEHGNLTGINEADDELVNVNLVEAQRTKHLKKVKDRAKLPVYSGIDSMEELDSAEAMARSAAAYRAGKSTKKVLGHYDELEERSGSLVLGDGGGVEGEGFSAEDGEQAMVAADVGFQSLVVAKKAMSDYMTAEELNSMKKPKKLRKKVKDKKVLRKTRQKDDDDVEEEGEDDFGSRNNGGGMTDEKFEKEKEAKSQAFLNAKLKANEKIQQSIQQIEQGGFSEEVDSELSASLARVRRMGQDSKERNRKLVENFTSKALEANIAAKAKAEELEQQQSASLNMNRFNKSNGDGVMSDAGEGGGGVDPASLITAEDAGKIVFTPTHEFSSRLEISLTDRKAERSMPPPPPPPPGPPPPSAFKDNGDEMTDDAQEEEQEGEEGESEGADLGVHGDAQMAFMHRQPLAKTGMAATLGLLLASGDLNKKDEIKIGRAKDARKSEYGDDEGGIRIEHRDADGRLLTQKEAFRQISYVFHGHGPKLKKQEKRRKEMMELEKAGDSSGQTFGTAAALQKALSASGNAYMPISGGAQLGRRAAGMSYVDDLAGEKESKKKKHKS